MSGIRRTNRKPSEKRLKQRARPVSQQSFGPTSQENGAPSKPASKKGNAHPPGKRRRTWRQDPDGRRGRILGAAVEEFARVGFRRARLGRVAVSAGVAEGTIYHQFDSKQGLLLAVGQRYGSELVQAAFDDLGLDPAPVEVARIVQNIFAYVRSEGGALTAFLLSHDPLEGGPAQDENRRLMITAIETQLSLWIERGQIAAIDTAIAAEIQFGLVESALRDCFVRQRGKDEERYVREVTRCLAAYIGIARTGPLSTVP
jgi:AcrR family transcriptional regulator